MALAEEGGRCGQRGCALVQPTKVERRSILRLGAAAAATAAGSLAPIGCVGVEEAASTEVADSGPDEVGSCQVSCSSDATFLELSFAQYPHLAQVGASAIVSVKGYADPACHRDAIIIAHASPGTFVALSASCTHMCCTVQFRGSDFYCPCHGSTFDLRGRVTGGPAPRPLASVGVCSDSCGVYVTVT